MADETSAWQMGNRTLERIHTILVECEIARNIKRYPLWFDKVVSLYFEILPFMEKDKSDIKSKIDLNIKAIKTIISNYSPRATNIKILDEKLFEVEGQLRVLLLKYNLLITKSDDPRAAVFRR